MVFAPALPTEAEVLKRYWRVVGMRHAMRLTCQRKVSE